MKQLIILWLLLIWQISFAQDFNLIGIEYKNHPATSLEYEDADRVLFNEMGVYINIPILFKDEKTIVIISSRYDRLAYQLSNSSNNIESSLHKVSLSLTGIYKKDETWTIVTKLRPGIGSDFKESFSLRPLLFEAAALLLKRQNKKLLIGAGVAFTNYAGKSNIIPLVFIDFKKDKHFIDAIVPGYAKYYFQVNKEHHLHIGFSFAFSNGTYRTSLEENYIFNSEQINDIVFNQFNIGPRLKTRFLKNVELDIFGGLTGIRTFNFRDETKLPIKLKPALNGFFQIGLNYIILE